MNLVTKVGIVGSIMMFSIPLFAQKKEPPAPDLAVKEKSSVEVMITGQPTEQELRKLKEEKKIVAVIDNRTSDEDRGFDEAKVAEKLGIKYFNIPVSPANLNRDTLEHFYKVMTNLEGPVLMHCASGNRSAALYYAYLVEVKGLPKEKARKIAKKMGLRSMLLLNKIDSLIKK